MNNHLDKTIKKYMRATRRLLICPKELRSQFIKDMEKDIDLFVQENEPDGYPDIISYFGTPAELAQTYLESVPQDELANYRIKRKYRTTILCIVLIALFLGNTAFLFYKAYGPRELDVIYTESYIEILDEHIE